MRTMWRMGREDVSYSWESLREDVYLRYGIRVVRASVVAARREML